MVRAREAEGPTGQPKSGQVGETELTSTHILKVKGRCQETGLPRCWPSDPDPPQLEFGIWIQNFLRLLRSLVNKQMINISAPNSLTNK